MSRYRTAREKSRAAWFADYEHRVVSAGTFLPGRVDWDQATYYWHQGLTAEQAAREAAETVAEEAQEIAI